MVVQNQTKIELADRATAEMPSEPSEIELTMEHFEQALDEVESEIGDEQTDLQEIPQE